MVYIEMEVADGSQVGFIIGGPQQSRKPVGENALMRDGAVQRVADPW
jgi:hypothetical protein